MAKKRIKKYIPCAVYLAVEAEEYQREYKEQKQMRYIKEYCKAHGLEVVKVYHSCGLSYTGMKRHFRGIAEQIHQKEFEAVVVAKMRYVSESEIDAYSKVGTITAVGGRFFSVDEGELKLNLKTLKEDAA